MSNGLQIDVEERGDKNVVRIAGRIDATSAPLLEKELLPLLDSQHKKMLMNFSKVDYLSSAGMRVLLSVTKKLKARGGNCVFYAINSEVMEIIKMAGFEKILSIYPDEKAALAAIERDIS